MTNEWNKPKDCLCPSDLLILCILIYMTAKNSVGYLIEFLKDWIVVGWKNIRWIMVWNTQIYPFYFSVIYIWRRNKKDRFESPLHRPYIYIYIYIESMEWYTQLFILPTEGLFYKSKTTLNGFNVSFKLNKKLL